MLGVCYYPEQWPETRWAEDARLMRECGLEIVRIGEFAWSRIEPHEGEYDWDWLDRAIDTLAAAGLRVILGTPTATPPAWLTQRYPDTLRVGADGRQWRHGGRRHTCPTSAAHGTYAQHSARIVTAISERYGRHHAVFAWQIDNELGNHSTARCACADCRSAFQAWCERRYGTLECLNEAWGSVFWSQSYNNWSQIPLPSDPVGGGHNPSLQLAYRRFSSDAHVQIVRQQAALLRQHSPGRTLTTNIGPLDDELDWHAIAAEVDVMSWDNYPHGFEDPGDVAFFHDLVRGLKRKPFWVMEQQPGRINWTPYNPPVPPGQVRLWTYQALAHGAENLLYFRWRAGRYGQEQYHSGLLNHDGTLTQGWHEARQVAHELGEQPLTERAPAQVALLVSYADAWTTQIEPHQADFDYWRMARTIYRDFWRRGINVDVIGRGVDLRHYRHVIPVAPLLIDQAEAHQWQAFVQQGGHLMLTIRSFVKDQENVWTAEPAPSGLTELVGGRLRQWYALPPGMNACFERGTGSPITTHTWVEDLQTSEPEIALTYRSGSIPGIEQLQSCSVQRVGQGIARYVGLYPSAPEAALFSSFIDDAPEAPPEPHLLHPDVEYVNLGDRWLALNHGPAPRHLNGDGTKTLPPFELTYEL